MFGSLVIRTAVNLSLIVVLTIQPVAVWTGAGRCDANAPANTVCGCCDRTAGQRTCGCCEKQAPERAEPAKSCCERASGVVSAEHSGEGVETVCGCGFHNHPMADTSGSRTSLLLRDAMAVALTTLPPGGGDGGLVLCRVSDLRSADMRPLHFAQIQYGNWRL